MKMFLVVLLALVAVASARPADAPPIEILRYDNEGVNHDGSYEWKYETANGIKAEETGTPEKSQDPAGTDVVVAKGAYSYTGDDGVTYSITYVADQNGFTAQGAHLPVAPPIPAAIQRALDYIRSLPPSKE